MKRILPILLVIWIGGSTACASNTPNDPSHIPTPTINPLFGSAEETPVPTQQETSETLPTPTSLIPSPVLSQTEVITITIYDDQLNPGWKLVDTEGMSADLSSTDYVHTGEYAIAMTPSQDFSTLYFAVQMESEPYPQDQVISISFWLNGGTDFIAPEDLAVTIVGSNRYSYWVADDKSVYTNDEFPFSETRLSFLDINRSVAKDTWFDVILWPDELLFDPIYENITGFYIKNDEGFFNTIYIDDIQLTMLILVQ
jgi:hypothetical protein